MASSTHPGYWQTYPALRGAALCGLLACTQGLPGVALWALCLAAMRAVSGRLAAEAAAVADAGPAATEPPGTEPGRPSRPPHSSRAISPRGRALPAEPRLAAHFDALTGLANAAYISDMAGPLMQGLHERQLSLCVLHVTLEGMAPVVERYGQRAGEHVLRQAAKRLQHVVRGDDLIARWGDTGFLLLLVCPEAQGAALARTWAARVKSELQRPLPYRTVSNLHIGWNIGSAAWPLHGETLDDVIRHAEAAWALAQRSGRGQARHHVADDSVPA